MTQQPATRHRVPVTGTTNQTSGYWEHVNSRPERCERCRRHSHIGADRTTLTYHFDGTPEGVWQCGNCGAMTTGVTS